MPLTLHDLVTNRTMSPAMAATLATAASERRSLLFVAIPRMAGKSTVMHAALEYAPAGTAFHQLSRREAGLGIPATGDGGYLLMSEVSQAGFDDYLWGDEVVQVFAALRRGFSLATALHAGSPDEAFAVLGSWCGVPDADAAQIELMTYIRSIGPWQRPTRRVVDSMYELGGVNGGVPDARLLHRWVEAEDRWEALDAPRNIGTPAPALLSTFEADISAGSR
jgi:hypothetical protein